MENQVLTIPQMKELEALGIDTSKASCIWNFSPSTKKYKLSIVKDIDIDWILEEDCPTFTLQDILNIMPNNIKIGNISRCYLCLSKQEGSWICSYNHSGCDGEDPIIEDWGNTPLEAAFEMLKYCKQNNYL